MHKITFIFFMLVICQPYKVSICTTWFVLFSLFCLFNSSFCLQFGQVGVGDNIDKCTPVQVKFPNDQAHSCYCSSRKLVKIAHDIDIEFRSIFFFLLPDRVRVLS